MVVIMFLKDKLIVSVCLVVLLNVCVVFGQSNGNFWWKNQKLVNHAKEAREAKISSARVINIEPDDDIKPVTEILDDIPPPVTLRNFIRTTTTTTTLIPQTRKENIVRRPKITRNFLFPDELTTKPPKGVQFQDNNNILETGERSRKPQTFFLHTQERSIETPTTTTESVVKVNRKRVRFEDRSADLTGSASETLETYKDLSRYLTFS